MVELHLSQDTEADRLLSEDPLALLIGMVLDQQVPLEWAFAAPAELRRRLGGTLDAQSIARMDPDDLSRAFSAKPALHRYPGSMAARVQEMCKVVVDRYGGKAEQVWSGSTTGAELLARINDLPGFGEHKAKIFVALLGKQVGVRPPGWESVSAPFGDAGGFRSVADIVDETTLARVRAFKQEMKAAKAGQKSSGAPAKKSATKKSATKAATKKSGGTTKAAAAKENARTSERPRASTGAR